jgi:AbrB family looped-hinge helix DNA binding protein
MGPDGLTTDENCKVPASQVSDVQLVRSETPAPVGPMPAMIGERGTITIPSALRRRHQLRAGSPVLIEERGDEIVIVPAAIVPRPI